MATIPYLHEYVDGCPRIQRHHSVDCPTFIALCHAEVKIPVKLKE